MGNNTNWQTETITFTATQNGTPLQITGIEPGMLLDDLVLTTVPGNLYYLPEQSLDAFTGEGGSGDWQLEIQDDRAGAYDEQPARARELGPAFCFCRHQRHSGC